METGRRGEWATRRVGDEESGRGGRQGEWDWENCKLI